jgi:hypothetical protein
VGDDHHRCTGGGHDTDHHAGHDEPPATKRSNPHGIPVSAVMTVTT